MNEETQEQEVQQETPVQEVEQEAPQQEEQKPAYETLDDGTFKIDLDAVQQQETTDGVQSDGRVEETSQEQPDEKNEQPNEPDNEEGEGVLEKVEEEPEATEEEVLAALEPEPEVVEETPQQQLPEGVEKLVQFLDETGGTMEDYINLNRDVDKMDPVSTIREYYKKTKPYLTDDQIQRQLNKKFYYGEDAEPDEVEDKKIAFQEELFKAKEHITGQRDKYYQELKLGSKLPADAQEALKFQQENKQAREQQENLTKRFLKETDKVFNTDFKGFEYSVGDSKYRYKVGDTTKVKEFQSDLNNFVGQYLNEDGAIKDADGYHKALFTAQNADKIAQHFYEQGRADAIQNAAKEANNIDMDPRQDQSAVVTPSGNSVKVVAGDSMDKLRIKWNK